MPKHIKHCLLGELMIPYNVAIYVLQDEAKALEERGRDG
jgi:hypothetical protein